MKRERRVILNADQVRDLLGGKEVEVWEKCREQPPQSATSVVHAMIRGKHCVQFRQPDNTLTVPCLPVSFWPGQDLWGAETWGAVSKTEIPAPIEECNIEYKADLPDGCDDRPGQWPAEFAGDPDCPWWRSPSTMPRWASRLSLTTVSVDCVKRDGVWCWRRIIRMKKGGE